MFVAIFECELGDARFVEIAEAFVDHAVCIGRYGGKTFVLSGSASADGESGETSWHKPKGSHVDDIGVKIGLRFSPASLTAGFAASNSASSGQLSR